MNQTSTEPTGAFAASADDLDELLAAKMDEVRRWRIGLRTGATLIIDMPTRDAITLMSHLAAAMAKQAPQIFVEPRLLTVLRADQVDYIHHGPVPLQP